MQESGWYFGGRRRWLVTAVLISAVLSTVRAQVIPGEPPAFPSTDDPRDQFVFERDADDMPVSLVFTCPVTGTGPPTINWFRGVPGGDFMMDNEFIQDDGSYIFPNITEANSAYASGDGIEYYCTATNAFGTIRSRTVRAFYADFKGFAINGTKVPEGTDPVEREVDVIVADVATNLQWVSLECEVVPGSTPTPEIQWIRTDTDGENLEVLTEDFDQNTVRFIDGGQWLILETTEAAVTGKVYYCQVTNKQRFQTVRGPITYTLNPGEPLSSLCGNEVSFHPPSPVTSFSDEPDGIAYGGGTPGAFTQLWRVNGRSGGTRVLAGGPVASILPQLIDSDMGPELDIQLVIAPAVEADELTILSATLTLLDPAVILDPKPENEQDRLSGDPQSFTCNVGGSDPTIKFYHNGNELTSDMDGVEINDGTLTIESTNPGHSGMYQCIVENNSGSDGFSWYLIVRDAIAPMIVTSFHVPPDPCVGFSFIQAESAPVLLSVNVTADPCPTVVWTRNGEPIPEAEATPMGDCADTLGRKSFLFSLMVNELTNDGKDLRAYGATLTNVAGSISVPDTVVTGRVRADITDLRTDPDSPIEGHRHWLPQC
ncbi:Contactin-5 [Geodia barretti]|uniref:Contactin-5 n=1 Tax=Geodia barretti TaxID=519541 RepID=A0AA35X4L6_GEOBA|nr:Contactin-5 [Geodia barretti]